MAAELPRPGVEVIQVFRTTSPTVITPTLTPCVVGVAKQIVDVLVPTGSGSNTLNTAALINMPGFFISKDAVGDPPIYSILDGDAFSISVNGGADITLEFSDLAAAGLSPADIVAQVNEQLLAQNVSSIRATQVGDLTWRLATVGLGEFQYITILDADASVLSAFGIGIGKTYAGLDNYNQLIAEIPQANFPDPRSNLSQLAIENDSIRVFLATGNGANLLETSRTSAFCRNGATSKVVVTGITDIALLALYGGAGTLDTTVLNMSINGATSPTALTFDGATNAVDEAAMLAAITATFPGVVASFVAVGPVHNLVLTTTISGAPAQIRIFGGPGTANAILGLSVSDTVGGTISAVDDGNGDTVTPLIEFGGYTPQAFTVTPTQAVLTASSALTLPPAAGSTLILNGGDQTQTITFDGTEVLAAAVHAAINAVVGPAAGGHITASGATLVLTHDRFGTDSVINIVGGTALATSLDPGVTPTIVAGATKRGIVSKPEAGDSLYLDGSFYATILQVAPGLVTSRVKIDRQVPIKADLAQTFYIVANNLPGIASRPLPELTITLNGDVVIKQEILREITGTSVGTLRAPIYLAYKAVRKDVTSAATSPGLLRYDNTTTLTQDLSPINVSNPLALGLFFALLNAPGAQVTGIGVDEVSADSPYGTVEGFTRAAEYLENFEVYAIAPLTHDDTVGQVYNTHITVMSSPANKGERIAIWNPATPTKKLDTLVASGSDGNSSGPSGTLFDTGVANLSALLLNAGVNPVGTIPVSKGVFLDIASDSKHYSVQSISGATVTIRTVFGPGENTDAFYSTTDLNTPPLPASLIEEAFSVKVRGAALATVSGMPDRNGIAATVTGIGQSFLNRRFWMTFPDKAGAVIEGTDQIVEGFYMNAAIAGMIGQQPPQQSFTNFPMTGFTRVIGSSEVYSERQLNQMAAGGTYIIVQDFIGAPLIARMALTTDLTSVETRTDSITKVVDFTAKFLRKSLKNFIGRFNITQGLLDSLGTVIQGSLGFLIEHGILIGGQLNNIVQDETAPDTVLIDITLDVPYPCNYIRLTLFI